MPRVTRFDLSSEGVSAAPNGRPESLPESLPEWPRPVQVSRVSQTPLGERLGSQTQ